MKESFGASPSSGPGRVDDMSLSFTSTFIFDVRFSTFDVWFSTFGFRRSTLIGSFTNELLEPLIFVILSEKNFNVLFYEKLSWIVN